jgi:SAM-dependent methyltransferase
LTVAAEPFLLRYYPEIAAGGFSHVDGTVQFYLRVNALLRPEFRVLDLGAGRGWWLESDPGDFRRQLRLLRGKVAQVVGQDLDPIVATNASLDAAVTTRAGERLPFDDGHFDLVLADYVLEHVEDPGFVAGEICRLLKPGGWFCARTPNRWGYVSIAARMLRNENHAPLLRLAQPDRKELDIFPTVFRMNSMADLRRLFPSSSFENFSYYYQAEPSYHFNSRTVFAAMRWLDKLLPNSLKGNLFVFLRRK